MSTLTRIAAAALLTCVMAVQAVAQSTQVITIENRTGSTLWRLYASGQSNPSWEQDLLGQYVMPPNSRQQITFRNVRECWYDLLFEFQNGQQYTDVVNICDIRVYTLWP